MPIEYQHSLNPHGTSGPALAVQILLARSPRIKSILDVGCGTGTWLKAFLDQGVAHCRGVDGVAAPDEELQIPRAMIEYHDLTKPLDLGETFDLAICLEVGEHLDEEYASQLVRNITTHARRVYFSAAIPGQPGQHHVNCQWPSYWQAQFNRCGFVCSDNIRREIWALEEIEPWYRQNLIEAEMNSQYAGKEPRISAAIHPEILPSILESEREKTIQQIVNGCMPVSWYASIMWRGCLAKLSRAFHAHFSQPLKPQQ